MQRRVRYLYFDVFGTVVDWYSSIRAQLEEYLYIHGIDFDAGLLTREWRGLYGPSMMKVINREIEWANLDKLHACSFGQLVRRYQLPIPESDYPAIAQYWHYLAPWEDSVPALLRLRRQYMLVALSNGHLALLADMAKSAGLPWDLILGSDIPRTYKRDPRFFEVNLSLLGPDARNAIVVAAHAGDLRNAKQLGMQAAFVRRPLEYGEEIASQSDPETEVDYLVDSLDELADQLLH